MKAAKSDPKVKVTTEDPELAERFNRVLNETVEAMEGSGIQYVFIGGIASGGLGRPRSTHDIDVFVRPEDAELALRALAKRGFRTEKTDPSWLYKGFKEDILVDVIFKSKGEIYLDSMLYQRSITAEFHGKKLKLVAPEDLVIIKAAAHSELTPGHWHDALALLTHATIDWDYLISRARKAPRRILSLLLYAQSNDILVPKHVIDQLYQCIFGDAPPMQSARFQQQLQQQQNQGNPKPAPLKVVSSTQSPQSPSSHSPAGVRAHSSFAVERLREVLAEDSRTNELDIQIEQTGDRILLRGEVPSEERRVSAEKVSRECFPEYVIENQIRVSHYTEPLEAEEMK